ncbi:MAG: (d)CMP kinase [Persephonella sp.]|nr:(d)CMP kinase [Persephonella sp.]
MKIFLTASPEERAKRRYKELEEKGLAVSYEDILKQVKERDYLDETRKDSPLKPADDAVIIDTSDKSIEQVFGEVMEVIERNL